MAKTKKAKPEKVTIEIIKNGREATAKKRKMNGRSEPITIIEAKEIIEKLGLKQIEKELVAAGTLYTYA